MFRSQNLALLIAPLGQVAESRHLVYEKYFDTPDCKGPSVNGTFGGEKECVRWTAYGASKDFVCDPDNKALHVTYYKAGDTQCSRQSVLEAFSMKKGECHKADLVGGSFSWACYNGTLPPTPAPAPPLPLGITMIGNVPAYDPIPNATLPPPYLPDLGPTCTSLVDAAEMCANYLSTNGSGCAGYFSVDFGKCDGDPNHAMFKFSAKFKPEYAQSRSLRV